MKIKYFNALIDKEPFTDQSGKTYMKCMKNLLKYQKMMII